jgi:glutaredoxin
MQITLYGAQGCEDTEETREHLDRLGIAYQYVDVDADPEAKAWVTYQNRGTQKTPTLDVCGQILVEPDRFHLEAVLRDTPV